MTLAPLLHAPLAVRIHAATVIPAFGLGTWLIFVSRKGARVTVVSTVKSQPPMASDDLRRQADNFIDLADLADLIGRPSRLPRFIQESRTGGDRDPEAYAED